MSKRNNLELIAQRAKSGGYKYGDHAERDKERGRTHYDEKTLVAQDQVLHVYLAWCFNRASGVPLEQCDTRFLSPGTPLLKIEELKDFWRFFALQSSGRITLPDGSKTNCPTVVTLRGKAKVWKAGFLRRTGQKLSDDDTAEINRWLKNDLPYEETEEGNHYCRNIQKPKFNFQPGDLDRLIDQVWSSQDTKHIYDRNRLQFHLQLLLFCHSGARRGALLKFGVPYKDIHLVLSPHQGEPQFFYRLAQRHVKNNKDPDVRTFGNSCKQHCVLRYDSVSILLMLAVADGALDREDLTRMIENGGEGQVEWSERCRDLPICRSLDQQGDVHNTQPMTEATFIEMFKMFLMQAGYTSIPGYLFQPGSIHMIRRELGKQLDGQYTEVERSQHLTQADKAVFGQSYTADTSSCDGLSAFLREKPDHRAVEYFQGLSQFRYEGLPTQLPAALKDQVSRDPAVLKWDRKIAQASDAKTRKDASQKRQKALDQLQKLKLEEHRRKCLVQLKREKLFNGRQVQAPTPDLDPLHMLRPEKARLAQKMAKTSPASHQDRLDAMRDMLSLLAAPTVFYLPGEEPENGECPYCSTEMESPPATRMQFWERDADAIHHMEEAHEWPWSCAECNFSGESGEACYHHLHDTHGYQLVKERRFGGSSDSTSVTPRDKSDDWMSELIQFSPSSPELSTIGTSTNEHIPHILPLDDRDGGWASGCRETLIKEMPEDVFARVRFSQEPSKSDVNTTSDPDPCLGSSAMSYTESLDLASAAKSSLALLGVLPFDSSTPESSLATDQMPSTSATIGDINLVSSNSPPRGMPNLNIVSPCATTNTGSATPSPATSGGKKRRIKFITTTRQSEPTDDIESPPAPKKCRIILKIRPRTVSEKEHAGGDDTAVQAWAKHRDEQTEIEKPAKTRIIFKTGSCQTYSHRATTPLKTWLSGTASTRSKWTLEEDEMVCKMKQDNCSWAKIQRALPHRSQGSIQVRYSTKLK
ncbi:uncharacterized protein FRV6_08866 [Fusarium oxysporum]|uniref:Myb-like domain-containing protein n=1 Tax=Fusarium oxysporum TaxID=5507 RepID=A0A2H3TSA0_FUSOX|nr:uncharacterized protein FRV6_08866 [Fusarium oxysporum]